MRKIVILILYWLILIGSGCGARSGRVQTGNLEDKLPVIVSLETRNEVVSIMSGYERPVYTVTTRDGRILGKQLSEQELQVKLPNIYHFLKTSYADDDKGSVIWAGG
ncbi:MAG TPA: hypothetical protein VMW72_19305 [Sedimentisphaerales bacterium]|nr:hypothetical protein [Sedimentisphaerales bacterium]